MLQVSKLTRFLGAGLTWNVTTFSHTVKCRYNAVQFIVIFHTALQWHQQNINLTRNSQQTPHSSPVKSSYGMSVVRKLEKIDCVITALHCICQRKSAWLMNQIFCSCILLGFYIILVKWNKVFWTINFFTFVYPKWTFLLRISVSTVKPAIYTLWFWVYWGNTFRILFMK